MFQSVVPGIFYVAILIIQYIEPELLAIFR